MRDVGQRLLLLSGGGTLGSVTPLLAVVEQARLAGKPYRFAWVGTARGPERLLVERHGVPFYAVPAGRWRRYWDWRNLMTPFLVIAGFVRSWQLLGRLRPAAVLTAGGFVSVPLAWAAWLRRVPVTVHDQDVRVGLANRLMRPCAVLLTSVWPRTGGNALVLGNFVRPSVRQGNAAEVRLHWRIAHRLPVALVLGGGTGALALNRLVVAALPRLRKRVFTFHLAGPGRAVPAPPSPHYVQLPFASDELPNLYAAADLVVTRAGLGTLAELAALSKPAVVVPIPHSHQDDNARRLSAADAAVVLSGQHATAEALAQAMLDLLADGAARRRLGERLHRLIPDGTAAFLEQLDALWR